MRLFDRQREDPEPSDVDALVAQCRREHWPALDLSGRDLTAIPPEVFALPWLATLVVAGNRITVLPDEIASLKVLTSLSLRDNPGIAVSPAIGKLRRLRSLDATGIQRPLPVEVGRCHALRELRLGRNRLTRVPRWIEQLGDLKVLDLSENEIDRISEYLFPRMSRLRELCLSGNRLTTLPVSIGGLHSLERLHLGGNALETLPAAVAGLTELRVVELAHNAVHALPDEVAAWTKLEILDLNHDPDITSWTHGGWDERGPIDRVIVGTGIGHWTRVRGTGLTEMPRGLANLPGLHTLVLFGHPGLGLPDELLGLPSGGLPEPWSGSVPAILDYLARTRRAARPLNEAKLVVLGWGGAGKTSVVNRLVHGTFTEGEARTEGIAVTAWRVDLPGSDRATLNVWDFGGQEIMHATHQFFLTTRSVYLLVLNGRNGSADSDAEHWLTIIESLAPGVPVVVALNQIERDPFDLDETGLRSRYPSIRAIVRTDCRSGLGLDALRAELVGATDRLPDLRVPFPASWIEIKDRLSGMADDYLTFDRFRELCTGLGEDDHADQERLAGYLHCLGIALNYRDDPRLRDTHVLNPHWVTEGIYAILNSRSIAAQAGELHLDQLGDVLDPDRYPPDRQLFLLDLMRKFDLCFAYPDATATWLVPELLPKQQPAEAQLCGPGGLQFEFGYPIVPEGLIPRFIVRSSALSTDTPRWRNGVVLRWEGCHAVVTLDPSRSTVEIDVCGGDAPSRRRLLAVVRSDFEALHRGFRFPIRATVPIVVDGQRLAVDYGTLLLAERDGRTTWPERVGLRIVDVDVRSVLEGVDLAPASARPGTAARLFVSYSHRDDRHRERLDAQLKVLQRSGLVDTWHDRRLKPGDGWRGTIDAELDRADVVVCLLTPDFLASDYCMDVEMERARERHAQGTCRVLPVVVRACLWHRTPLAELQAVPRDGRPVESAPDRDVAWREVGDAIGRVAEALRGRGDEPGDPR